MPYPRNNKSDRGGRGRDNDARGGFRKPGFGRRRQCKFCSDKELHLNYKNLEILAHFISEKGKIVPRRISGNCAKHQRWMSKEIKRGRQLAMYPYTSGIFGM